MIRKHMAKSFNADWTASILNPFKDEAGAHFPKLVADVTSFLGQYASAIQTVEGEWKAGTKGKITSKTGNSLQLPLNSALTALIQFSLRIRELEEAGSVIKPVEHRFEIQCNFPAAVEGWFNQNYRKKDATVTA